MKKELNKKQSGFQVFRIRRTMNEESGKKLLDHLQGEFDSLPAGAILEPPGTCTVCGTNPCNAVHHHFGTCPICHKTDGYLNVGNDHWFLCHTHKTKWAVGANLFSSCMDETPEQQRAEQEKIGFASYEKVAPHFDTTGADEESDGCPCFRCEDSDVKDVEFNAPKLTGELWVGDFYIYPVDEDVIYTTCPLCGCDSGIYGGNRWYTQACCYFHVRDKNISLEVERWVTEHLLSGESIDEAHAKLTALRGTTTLHSYVERIDALLNDARTADAYKFYLERTGTMDEWVHEQAADAAEVQE
jgi:hypothetical protein